MAVLKGASKIDALIAILIVIAVVLGIAIVSNNKGILGSLSSIKVPTGKLSSSQPLKSNQASGNRARPTPPGLNDQEKAIMSPPNPDASKSESNAFFERVRKLAKDGIQITLNKCDNVSPLVMRVKEKTEFEVINNDTKSHFLSIGGQDHKIEAKETVKLTANFQYGVGTYGYTCDGIRGVVGYLDVTPANK